MRPRIHLAWMLGLAAFSATLIRSGQPLRAEDAPPLAPPSQPMGMPLPGGGALWRATGLERPPGPGSWAVERAGSRRFGGRDVDVLRYVPNVAPNTPVPPGYGQADFVDPTTGEVVGGQDGWGREQFPDEGSEPRPCPGH